MYVPIVASLPGGNGSATITRFAWFYVTGTSGGGSRLVINGQWVSLPIPATGQTGPYVPGLPGAGPDRRAHLLERRPLDKSSEKSSFNSLGLRPFAIERNAAPLPHQGDGASQRPIG